MIAVEPGVGCLERLSSEREHCEGDALLVTSAEVSVGATGMTP